MRIGLLTIGSRGDVEPIMAIALALQAAGHEPTVATHESFRSFVTGRGLAFAPLTGDPEGQISSPRVQNLLASGRNPLKMLRGFADVLDDVWPDYVASTTAACQGQDALLYSPLAFSAWHLGQALGVPTGMVAFQPFAPTAEHLPAGMAGGRSLGALVNRAAHRVNHQVAWRLVAKHIDPWRSEVLGLPRLGKAGFIEELHRSHEPIIHAYSPTLVPPPNDWPEWNPVTGWCVLDRDDDWTPPADLVDFIGAGPPPIYAGFGSMVDARAPELTEAVLSTLSRSSRRAVIVTGWGGLTPGAATDDVFVARSVPHSWLLPQMAAAIHHGGAGTTGAVTRAGIPHIVAPVFGDQHFWARAVTVAGVGATISRTSMAALDTKLAQVTSPSTRSAATEMGTEVVGESGVADAVSAIEKWVLARV